VTERKESARFGLSEPRVEKGLSRCRSDAWIKENDDIRTLKMIPTRAG
jgi:hypothetical protein